MAPTETATPLPSNTPILSETPFETLTETSTQIPVPTDTETSTATLSPTETVTATDLETVTDTATGSATASESPTATSSVEAFLTPTEIATLSSEPPLSVLFEQHFEADLDVSLLTGYDVTLVYYGEGNGLALPADGTPFGLSSYTLSDVAVEVRFRSTGNVAILLRSSAEGQYIASLSSAGQVTLYRDGTLLQSRFVSASQPNQWRTLRASMFENVLRMSVDGVPLIEVVDTLPLENGAIAFSGLSDTIIDDIIVWAPSLSTTLTPVAPALLLPTLPPFPLQPLTDSAAPVDPEVTEEMLQTAPPPPPPSELQLQSLMAAVTTFNDPQTWIGDTQAVIAAADVDQLYSLTDNAPTGYTIYLLPGTYVFSHTVYLSNTITIRGQGRDVTIIQPSTQSPPAQGLFYMASNHASSQAVITLSHVTLQNSNFQFGGAIIVNGSLSSAQTVVRLEDSTFKANQGQYGGALYVNQSYVSTDRCYFLNNHASSYGGAVYEANVSSVPAFTSYSTTRFEGNSASSSGGALYSYNSRGLTIGVSSLVGNSPSHISYNASPFVANAQGNWWAQPSVSNVISGGVDARNQLTSDPGLAESNPPYQLPTPTPTPTTTPSATPTETPVTVEVKLVEGNITQPVSSGTLTYEITVTNQGSLAQTDVVVRDSTVTLLNETSSAERIIAYEISQDIIDDENITISDQVSNGATFTIAAIDPLTSLIIRVTVTIGNYNYRTDGVLLHGTVITQLGTEEREFDRAELRLPRGLEANFYHGFEVSAAVNTAENSALILSVNGTLDLSQLETTSPTSEPDGSNYEIRQASYRLTGWFNVPETETPIQFSVDGSITPYSGLRVWVNGELVFSRWAGGAEYTTNLTPGPDQQVFIEFYYFVPPETLLQQPALAFSAPALTWTASGLLFSEELSPVRSDGSYAPVEAFPSPQSGTNEQPGAMAHYATCPAVTPGIGRIQLVPVFTGQGQETFDMRAVAEFRADGTTPSGLVIHDGPTWNAMQFDADPTTPGFDPIPWGSILEVDQRIVFEQTGGIADQVWYRLGPSSEYYDENNDRWIAVRMAGTLRTQGTNEIQPFVYIVGFGRLDADTSSLCSQVTDIRTVPQTDPDALISFTYDRQAAAEYGIAHAYRNSIRYNDGGLPSGVELPLYPAWVESNFQRRVTRYFASDFASSIALTPFAPPYANAIRYAPFWYGQVYGYGGFTGSAVFNSELIWMGGLPMTKVSVDCSDASINTQWRYCPENDLPGLIGASSGPWDTHTLLTEYYSKDNTVPGGGLEGQRGQFIGILDMYDPANPNFAISPLCTIVVVAGDSPIQCNANARDSGFPNLDNADNAARMFALLTDPAFLDDNPGTTSVFTDIAYGGSDRKLDQTYPGDISVMTTGDYITVETDDSRNDGHGFFVVGWGPISSCATAMSQTWMLEDGGLYSAYQDALEAYPQGIVPYVVDFPGGVDRTADNIAGALAIIAQGLTGGMYTDQLQRPFPRPFYCSAYNDPERNATERFTDGIETSRLSFDATQQLGFWRFYTILPRNEEGLAVNRIFVSAESIYVPVDEWFWNADPNRCLDPANCGG